MNTDAERAGLGSGSGYALDKGCAANKRMAAIAKEQGKEPEVEADAEAGNRIHQCIAGYICDLQGEELETATILIQKELDLLHEFIGGRNDEFTIKREQRVWIHKGITPIFSCKPDYVCTVNDPDGAEILIIDHKTGHNDPTENDPDCSQLEAYALAEERNCVHPLGVKRVIAYYNTRWHGHIRKEFSQEDLDRIYKELMVTIEEASSDTPRANPGWYCRYCNGRLVCPAANREITKVDTLGALSLPDGKEGERFIELVKRVQPLCEQILKHYTTLLTKKPGCCGDWAISKGTEERTIDDIEKVYTVLVGETGAPLSHEAFLKCCKGLVGKLEKEYCNVAGKIQKHAKEDFNRLLDGAITLKRKAGSLQKVRQLP